MIAKRHQNSICAHLKYVKKFSCYFSSFINLFMKWSRVTKYITFIQHIYVLPFSLLIVRRIIVNFHNWSVFSWHMFFLPAASSSFGEGMLNSCCAHLCFYLLSMRFCLHCWLHALAKCTMFFLRCFFLHLFISRRCGKSINRYDACCLSGDNCPRLVLGILEKYFQLVIWSIVRILQYFDPL